MAAREATKMRRMPMQTLFKSSIIYIECKMEEVRDLMEVALEEDITVEDMYMNTNQDTEDLLEWVFGSNIEISSSNLEEDGYCHEIDGPP